MSGAWHHESVSDVTIKPPVSAYVAATLCFLCVPLALWAGASGDSRCCYVGRAPLPQDDAGVSVHGGVVVLLTVASCVFAIVSGLRLLGPRVVVGADEVRLRSRWWRVRTVERAEVVDVRLEPKRNRLSLVGRKGLAPALVLSDRIERLGFLETSDAFAAEFRLRHVQRVIFPAETHT